MPHQARTPPFTLLTALLHFTSFLVLPPLQCLSAPLALLAPSSLMLDRLFHLLLLNDGHRLLASTLGIALAQSSFIRLRSDFLPYAKGSITWTGTSRWVRWQGCGGMHCVGLVHLLEVEVARAGADATGSVLEEAVG